MILHSFVSYPTIRKISACFKMNKFTKSLFNDLNEIQRKIVHADFGGSLVIAGPGSGKTRVLTHRIAYLLRDKNQSPFSILALTFTNKAGKEIKERLKYIVDDRSINKLSVCTFHSFCVKRLRMHSEYLSSITNNTALGNDFSIYDRDDSLKIIKELISKRGKIHANIKAQEVLEELQSAKYLFHGFPKRTTEDRYYDEVHRLFKRGENIVVLLNNVVYIVGY